MKKILSLIALVIASGPALMAQFSMSASDFPVLYDNATYFNLDTTGIQEGPGGSGQTWDFSGGTVTSLTRTLNIIPPANHPDGGSFGTSSFAYDFSNGDYRFYTVDGDSLVLDGEVSVLNSPIPYSDKATLFNYPVSAGTVKNSSYYSYYNTGAAGFAYRTGTTTTIIDASGMLMLPNGVVYNNVNRVVTATVARDSSQAFPVYTDITQTRVEWYQQGISTPVCWIDTRITAANGGAPTTTREIWYQDTGFVAIDEPLMDLGLNVFPNPASDQVRVAYDLQGQSEVKLELINLLGERVQVIEKNNQAPGLYQDELATGELARGVYFIRLTAGGSFETQKLILD